MDVRVFLTESEATAYAASIVETTVKLAASPVLGLATGSTTIPLYSLLASFHRRGLSFSSVTTLNLDEYVGLPRNSPYSFQAFMTRELFHHVDIPENNRHIPRGNPLDLAGECLRYDRITRDNPADLQILGLGVNGHIGFNEPSSTFIYHTHVVALADETIQRNSAFFPCATPVPREAITMGIGPIMKAKRVVLLAFGCSKTEAVTQALNGDIRPEFPATVLQLHPNATFILDEYAAARLL